MIIKTKKQTWEAAFDRILFGRWTFCACEADFSGQYFCKKWTVMKVKRKLQDNFIRVKMLTNIFGCSYNYHVVFFLCCFIWKHKMYIIAGFTFSLEMPKKQQNNQFYYLKHNNSIKVINYKSICLTVALLISFVQLEPYYAAT